MKIRMADSKGRVSLGKAFALKPLIVEVIDETEVRVRVADLTPRKRAKQRKALPARESLFWDTDPRTLDIEKHGRYIIERILDFGNDDEARWLWSTYPRELIRDVALTSRSIRPESRALWDLLTEET